MVLYFYKRATVHENTILLTPFELLKKTVISNIHFFIVSSDLLYHKYELRLLGSGQSGEISVSKEKLFHKFSEFRLFEKKFLKYIPFPNVLIIVKVNG